MTNPRDDLMALADRLRELVFRQGQIDWDALIKIEIDLRLAASRPAPVDREAVACHEPCCPFCGRAPFHYVDNGLGMEAVAVTCCDLGDLFYRGARPEPEEVTMSWDDFQNIGNRLTHPPVQPATSVAVLAERERCARICEGDFDSEMKSYGKYFAAAIREAELRPGQLPTGAGTERGE